MQGANYQPSVADARTAMAPFAARKGIAAAVGQAGEVFASIAVKAAQVEDARVASEQRGAWIQGAEELKRSLATETDPEKFAKAADEYLGKTKAALGGALLSPQSRAEMEEQFTVYEARLRSEIAGDALRMNQQRANEAFGNEMRFAMKAGDEGLFGTAIGNLKKAVPLTPEKETALWDDFRRTVAAETTQREITRNPAAWLAAHPAEQLPEGEEAVTWANHQRFARSALGAMTGELVDAIHDGMATGDIKTAEDIDALGEGRLRPAVLEQLKGRLAARGDALAEAERKSVPYQNQVVGRVSALINGYDASGEGFDAEMAEIISLLKDVEDPGTREALEKQWKEIESGQKQTLDSALKLAEKSLVDAFEVGRFGDTKGSGVASMGTRAAVDAGLLTDPDKLGRAGFTAEQIAALREKKLTATQRIQLFRQEYGKRAAGDEKLSDFERAAFVALASGKETFEAIDPEAADAALEAKLKAEERLGAARVELMKFARAYPNASKAEYEDEILRLAGAEARDSLRAATIRPRPGAGLEGGPKGAHAGTSVMPVGKDVQTMIKHFEAGGEKAGFHAKAYPDGRQWSIGYGTKARPGETIGQEEAQRRLDEELAKHAGRVDRIAGYLNLKPHERDALISFDFNTGDLEQLTANGTRGRGEIAAKMLLYRNATMNGKLVRLPGLVRRRQAEQYLFLNGYTN
jgi:GH24 family phage-related lysozyme (muramidase)